MIFLCSADHGGRLCVALLLAQSGALRSFGWAAVLGEAMAVAVVLIVLPRCLPPHTPSPDSSPA